MPDYWMIQTKTKEEDPGVDGGMMKKADPTQRQVNYVLVESVDQFSNKVKDLGGKIIVPKTEVQGMGHFAIALDPEGNNFGIWEATQR